MNTTELTPALVELLNTARGLPAELVRQVADYADFLGKKHGTRPEPGTLPVDESDRWTEEDLRDWSMSGAERLDAIPPAVPRVDSGD